MPVYDALPGRAEAHPGPPRAGRGAGRRRLCAGSPASRASASRPPVPARPTSSPASPMPILDSVPMVAITGQVPTRADGHRRLPGGRHLRHHPADREAQLRRPQPGRHSARSSPKPSASPSPGGPGPVLIDLPKDMTHGPVDAAPRACRRALVRRCPSRIRRAIERANRLIGDGAARRSSISAAASPSPGPSARCANSRSADRHPLGRDLEGPGRAADRRAAISSACWACTAPAPPTSRSTNAIC